MVEGERIERLAESTQSSSQPQLAEKGTAELPTSDERPENSDDVSNSTIATDTALAPENGLSRFASISRRDGRDLDGPPQLPLDLRNHKLALCIFTLLALIECCFVPVALYYGLRYGTNMRSGSLFL
jgi:hypothetical protein